MEFIWFIIIGLVSGWLAGKIMNGGGFGLVINLIVGVVGGVLGGWLFGIFGLSANGVVGGIVTSVIGAVVFLWILSFFASKRQG